MNDKERLNVVISHTGKRLNTLAKELGFINGSVLYNIKNGRNGVSAKLARKITEAYPEINQNWLITGKGEMLEGKRKDGETEKLIGKIEKLNAELLERIDFLRKHIKGLDARIELMEQLVNSKITNSNEVAAEPKNNLY